MLKKGAREHSLPGAHPPRTRAAMKAKSASSVMRNCMASEVCKGNVRGITRVGESSSIFDMDSLLLFYD